MYLNRLQVRNFRIVREAELEFGPGFNWITGENGSGKTSLLEALTVLARGRTFRATRIAGLIRDGESALQVVAHKSRSGGTRGGVLGVERRSADWEGRIDGQSIRRISEFARCLPLVIFEPGSHGLVDGPPEVRRQFLDWTMFHVEPDYLQHWRDFARALKQRNAGLRDHRPEEWIRSLDEPLAHHATRIDQWRRSLVDQLAAGVPAMMAEIGIRISQLEISYRPGWPAEMDFSEALSEGWTMDRERGFTGRGPQRGELELRVDGRLAGGQLSRGQQKLVSLGLLLNQHRILAKALETPPMLLLDDPVSELDSDHLDRLLGWVERQDAQVLVTAVSQPRVRASQGHPDQGGRVFHVEQGSVRSVV